MKKHKKIICSIILSAFFLIVPVICIAAQGISVTYFSNDRYESRYEYGTGGNRLELKVYFGEKHSTTKQEYYNYKTTSVSVGPYTYVENNRDSDLGYDYISIDLYGYVNSNNNAQLLDVYPVD